jgi:hypothetical protein
LDVFVEACDGVDRGDLGGEDGDTDVGEVTLVVDGQVELGGM